MNVRLKRAFFSVCAALVIVSSALIGAPTYAFADSPSILRLMNDDVLNTYYRYKCPLNISSHNMDYNKTYKLLSFRTGYAYDGYIEIDHWSAKNCACGTGTVYYLQCQYHTW